MNYSFQSDAEFELGRGKTGMGEESEDVGTCKISDEDAVITAKRMSRCQSSVFNWLV